MATQGLVTIRKDGKVIMKVVAGIDGQKADEVATSIRRHWPMSQDEVYRMARHHRFGDEACLVVITADSFRFDGDGELSELYRNTFDQPEFNPRWEHGTADYVVVVDL